jgi:hypothetical protein
MHSLARTPKDAVMMNGFHRQARTIKLEEMKKNKQHFTRWRKDNIYINRRTSKYEKQTMSYSSPTPVHNQKKTKTDNSFVTCEKRKKIIPQVEPLLVETERAAHLK